MLKTNRKLGPGIVGFSLPNVGTCPGRSALCTKLCYVNRFTKRFTDINYDKELKLAKSKRFVKVLTNLIQNAKDIIRIHVSGDFFSAAYTALWLDIVKAFPNKTFFAYTRSWRVPAILPALEELAAQPNMRLWASCDKETGLPTVTWPKAYLMVNDQDIPPGPVDLAFRNIRKTFMHHAGNTLVCPHEFGIKNEVNCSNCRRCFR